MIRRAAAALMALGFAHIAAHAQNPSAALGKERAAASKLQWQTGEAGHPRLGNIRFAFTSSPVQTPVGNAKVFSTAYVSCQTASGKVAIELANATARDDPGGLKPAAMPRLVCHRPVAPGEARLVEEELLANWEVNPIGDVMTRGFRPFPLRECVAIGVVQEVALPKGWARDTAAIEFEITPYTRELDTVFAACGDTPVYAAAPAASGAKAPPAAARAPAARKPTAGWQAARTTASGKTNVRAKPTLQSAVVGQLHPGALVVVQHAEGDWWRVRPSSGTAFEGYVRRDRIVVD